SVACAQSFNIDFGTGAGVPDDTYAAAGLAGRWNAVAEGVQGPVLLLGLDGTQRPAGIFIGFGGGTIVIDDPGTTGNDARLLDDFRPGLGDVVRDFFFVALDPGYYRVLTYAWTPSGPADRASVSVNDQWQDYQIVGGPWPGHLEQGVTHALHYANV